MTDCPRAAAAMASPEAVRVLSLLRDSSKIVLTTHEGADGDGIGAEIALFRGLRRLGKQVAVINPGYTARRFAFLDPDRVIRQWKPAARVRESELVVLVDTCELKRTGPIGAAISKRTMPTVAIDHHPRNHLSIDGLLASDFSSTGELMVHILAALGVEMTPDLADPLYCAILFDTFQFRFVRNDPEVFAVVSSLVRSGADAEGAAKRLFGTVRRDQTVLIGRALEKAVFEAGGRLAWSVVTPETRAGLDVDADEVRSVVMALADIEGVEVAVLFKVFREGEVKVSLRSRGSATVADVAMELGGGGHPYAAGAEAACDLNTAIERTLPLLRVKFSGCV